MDSPILRIPSFDTIPDDAAHIVACVPGELVVDAVTGGVPSAAVFRSAGCSLDGAILAAEYDGHAIYALRDDIAAPLSETVLKTANIRAYVHALSPAWRQCVIRALELRTWHREHAFCGQCGARMQLRCVDGAMECPTCGFLSFPILSPAVIVRITDGDSILLAKNHHFKMKAFTNFSGFVESGETLEDAIHREVREEVGVDVTDLRYFGSQNWPYPHSLLVAFTARYAGGDVTPDGEEIAEARWFRRQELPSELPAPGSISRALIDDFILNP